MAARLFATKAQYGFCNPKGEIIIPASYDNAKSNEFFNVFFVGDKWGFLDNDGKCLREAQYDEVELFGKYAIVNKDGFYGVLNFEMKEIFPLEFKNIQESCYKDFYILETKDRCYEIANSRFEIVEKTYKYTLAEDDCYCIVLFSKNDKKVVVFTCDRKHEFESEIDFKNFYVYATYENRLFIKAYGQEREESLIVVKSSDVKLNYIDGCKSLKYFGGCIDTYYMAEIHDKYYLYMLDDLTLVRVKEFEPCDKYYAYDDFVAVRRENKYYIYDIFTMGLKFKGNKWNFFRYISKNNLSNMFRTITKDK